MFEISIRYYKMHTFRALYSNKHEQRPVYYSTFATFYKDVFKHQFSTRWNILDVDMILRK